VERVFADPEHAATLLIFEEVGLDARSIGSPAAAAGHGTWPPTQSDGLPELMGTPEPTQPRERRPASSQHR
jgi:hypothetical protein